jgi:hypothetical protein
MGLDYSTQVGYGFSWPNETSADLLERLGLADHEIMGWPDQEVLESLGFSGLSILENYTMGDPGGWAIVLTGSYLSPDREETGITLLSPDTPSGRELKPLLEVRERLFPSIEGVDSHQPGIGWLLISSVY